jgi:hypothetical protein
VAFGAAVAGAASAPPEDRLLPPARHTSEKGRSLATKHARALRELNAEVYHCLPWLEVHKESIGFYRPRHVTGDVRFLSIRLYIEQEPSPEFASFTTERRASGMFSRYVGPMLQRMTRHPGLRNDDTIDGFTIILEWLKETPQARGQRPLHETIAVFVEKVDADDYLSGRTKASDLAGRARVFGFVGETALGPLKLSAWDDNFVSTFKMKDYQAEPGVACLQ